MKTLDDFVFFNLKNVHNINEVCLKITPLGFFYIIKEV